MMITIGKKHKTKMVSLQFVCVATQGRRKGKNYVFLRSADLIWEYEGGVTKIKVKWQKSKSKQREDETMIAVDPYFGLWLRRFSSLDGLLGFKVTNDSSTQKTKDKDQKMNFWGVKKNGFAQKRMHTQRRHNNGNLGCFLKMSKAMSKSNNHFPSANFQTKNFLPPNVISKVT